MSKLLILDKDWSIVKPASGGTFPQHPTDQVLLPGVAEAVAHYAEDGWTICIASNQGGVMHGYKSLDGAIEEMRYCMELLPEIKCAVFCPDDGKTSVYVTSDSVDKVRSIEGGYRKPDFGMIRHLQHLFPGATQALFVGDLDTDRQCAENAGVPFAWASDWVKPFVEDE